MKFPIVALIAAIIFTTFGQVIAVAAAKDGVAVMKRGVTNQPVCQIVDGQIQAGSGAECASLVTTTSAPAPIPSNNQPVCQIVDGQVQAGYGAECASLVTTTSSQAPASTPSNNQPVCQIGDGQVQAGNGAECASVVTTKSAPASTPSNNQPVCQINDGQVQAGNAAECMSTLTSTLNVPPPSGTPAGFPPASELYGTVITMSGPSATGYGAPSVEWIPFSYTVPVTTRSGHSATGYSASSGASTLSIALSSPTTIYSTITSHHTPEPSTNTVTYAHYTGGGAKLNAAVGGLAALAVAARAAV